MNNCDDKDTNTYTTAINEFIPRAKKEADALVASQIKEKGGEDKAWSILFHQSMNRLTVAAGLRVTPTVILSKKEMSCLNNL